MEGPMSAKASLGYIVSTGPVRAMWKELCRSKDRKKETDLVKRSTFQKPMMSSDQGHMHCDTSYIKVQGTRGKNTA